MSRWTEGGGSARRWEDLGHNKVRYVRSKYMLLLYIAGSCIRWGHAQQETVELVHDSSVRHHDDEGRKVKCQRH